MRPDAMLGTTSLLSIVLFSLHVADDIVRGISGGGLENLFGILILVVWLYAALVAIERPWGRTVLALGSLLAMATPILHLRGAGLGGALVRSSGAFVFIWVLYALGVTGAFGFLLSVRGLLDRRASGAGRGGRAPTSADPHV